MNKALKFSIYVFIVTIILDLSMAAVLGYLDDKNRYGMSGGNINYYLECPTPDTRGLIDTCSSVVVAATVPPSESESESVVARFFRAQLPTANARAIIPRIMYLAKCTFLLLI